MVGTVGEWHSLLLRPGLGSFVGAIDSSWTGFYHLSVIPTEIFQDEFGFQTMARPIPGQMRRIPKTALTVTHTPVTTQIQKSASGLSGGMKFIPRMPVRVAAIIAFRR